MPRPSWRMGYSLLTCFSSQSLCPGMNNLSWEEGHFPILGPLTHSLTIQAPSDLVIELPLSVMLKSPVSALAQDSITLGSRLSALSACMCCPLGVRLWPAWHQPDPVSFSRPLALFHMLSQPPAVPDPGKATHSLSQTPGIPDSAKSHSLLTAYSPALWGP